jgi:predicted MFS family arabinose efflux permease
MSSRHQGPFYGWWIVFAAAVGLFCGIPSTVYTFGVFVKPLIQEFHVSRAAISVSYTLWAVMYAVGARLWDG